ncbi:MAG: tRNA pseudouridine(38-40) synthase TruA [Pseudomonadales bacterium]
MSNTDDGLRRIALGVEYQGSHYHGWQLQSKPEMVTVQGELEKALACVANQHIRVSCAGRTDAGVHATAQVVHFDTSVVRPNKAWIYGSNNLLPDDIAVRWAQSVDTDFHARFSATGRRYRYIIYNSPVRTGILRQGLTWQPLPLDADLMHTEAQSLAGRHDFSSFRASRCQANSPVREVYSISVVRHRDLVIIDIHANAFLHHMVRNIAGVLMGIGSGRREPGWTQEVLLAKDRKLADVTAQPNGLYLIGVDYPDKWNLPPVPLGPVFLQAVD